MPVASMTKMTVPLASDQSAPAQGMLMPKLTYRFRVNFINFGVSQPTTELTKQVMDFTRPNVQFDQIELNIYNSKVFLAGKPMWQDITCTIRDDASGTVSRLVGEQLQKQFDFMEQSSASAGIDYKFLTQFQVLDGGNGVDEPNVLEDWELYGCFVKSVDYGSFDYKTSEAATIKLTLRIDNALQSPQNQGVGTYVGRTLGTISTQ